MTNFLVIKVVFFLLFSSIQTVGLFIRDRELRLGLRECVVAVKVQVTWILDALKVTD